MGTLKPTEWTEQRVQTMLNAHYMPRAKYIINNLYIFGKWESDYLAMTLSRYWYECEVKVTLADFKADFKNKGEKYSILGSGVDARGHAKVRPHFFSYAMPDDLAEKVANTAELRSMIPPFAGLVAVYRWGACANLIAPKRIHRQIYTDEELRLTDKFYYNFIEYKNKYNGFASELAKYRGEMNWLKAEFKAMTGVSWKEHKKDIL